MSRPLVLENVGKFIRSSQLMILKSVSFAVEEGQALAITGKSGSGKTTLLSLCAGLDVPSQGKVSLLGNRLNKLSEDQRACLRSKFVGFIFQDFQLMPMLTALDNVIFPLQLIRETKNAKSKALEILKKVGLSDRLHHFPYQLSGGEQQRVALARAFVHRPPILFADEPTGNLDEENANIVADLLFELNKEHGTTLILVTHENYLAERANRMIHLQHGKIFEETDEGY